MVVRHLCLFTFVHLLFLSTQIPNVESKISCIQCTNYLNKKSFDFCPVHSMVRLDKAFNDKCDGACFTRLDPTNTSVIVRGCTSYMSLPLPLPPEDGCYDWVGTVFCICRSNLCNLWAIGKSKGVALDDHLQEEYNKTGVQEGQLQCYQCQSHDKDKEYPQCPKNHRVNPMTVYRDNCTGACFTRSDPKDPKRVYRGCTDSQYGLPQPLPPDGCYNWNEAVYCICTKTSCNGRAIEPSSGKDLDYHLDFIDEEIEEPDGLRRCYQCINYDDKGNYYRQCPKNKRVRNAYLDVCNGTCFTRSYDYDDRKIARGCTTVLYGLPDPLPPDGCYTWYSEVWCVCSKSRCNGRALGKAQNIEFDAHIPKDGDAAVSLQPAYLLLHTLGLLVLVTIKSLAMS